MLNLGLGLGIGGGAMSGAAVDPSFSSTKLLLGFEGADGSTTFTDESAAARGNATVFGNAQVDTAQFKYGLASGLFDGAGDYLTFADSADWAFGSGAFTAEMFVRHNSLPATFSYVGYYDGAQGWRFRYTTGLLQFQSSVVAIDFAWVPTLAQWYHIAVDREAAGGIARLYINGVMVDKQAANGAAISTPTLALHIGRYPAGALHYLDGWMDELRITKGIARYASDSGFTVPTAAYPRS